MCQNVLVTYEEKRLHLFFTLKIIVKIRSRKNIDVNANDNFCARYFILAETESTNSYHSLRKKSNKSTRE